MPMLANASNLYALIIGISNYPKNLEGATLDAINFYDFLEGVGVPKGNMRLLKDATSDKIISALEKLAQGKLPKSDHELEQGKLPEPDHELEQGKLPELDHELKKGSAFVLFYAGHGTREKIPCTPDWTNYNTMDGKIECLVPSYTQTPTVIPSRIVKMTLESLAQNIGNNITVILDCCHSAGQTRKPPSSRKNGSIRFLNLSEGKTPNYECGNIFDTVGVGEANQGIRGAVSAEWTGSTHILLAACQRTQSAWGFPEGGLFTSALLPILKAPGLDSLTYAGIMSRLKVPDQLQTPDCIGSDLNRIIFTMKLGKPLDDCFVVENYRHRDDAQEDFWIIYGGHAHGIYKNDKVEIFDITAGEKFVGTAQVTDSYANCAKIGEISGPRTFGNYMKNLYKKLQAYIPNRVIKPVEPIFYGRLVRKYDKFEVFNGPSDTDNPSKASIKKAKFQKTYNMDEAMVIIKKHGTVESSVQFLFGRASHAQDAILRDEYQPYSVRANNTKKIEEILLSMFRFQMILEIPNEKSLENIEIRFLEVKKNPSGSWVHTKNANANCYRMTEPTNEIEIFTNGRFENDENMSKKHYGLSITNYTSSPLFAYILCLEPGELLIESWYSSTAFIPDTPYFLDQQDQLRMAADIDPKGSLSIGYDNSGVQPKSFILPDGLDSESTYFKIILTKSPTDFSMLCQTPPFLDLLGDEPVATRGIERKTSYEAAIRRAGAKQFEKRMDKEYYSATLRIKQSRRPVLTYHSKHNGGTRCSMHFP